MPYNNNNRVYNICQEDSNYEKIRKMVRFARLLRIPGSAFNVLLYQIDQEFGFIKDDEQKDGDLISHKTRARHLGISVSQDTDATKTLVKLNVFTVDKRHRKVSRYYINQDLCSWELWANGDDEFIQDSSDVEDTLVLANTNDTDDSDDAPVAPKLGSDGTVVNTSGREPKEEKLAILEEIDRIENMKAPEGWVDDDYEFKSFEVAKLTSDFHESINTIVAHFADKGIKKSEMYQFGLRYMSLLRKVLPEEDIKKGKIFGRTFEIRQELNEVEQ